MKLFRRKENKLYPLTPRTLAPLLERYFDTSTQAPRWIIASIDLQETVNPNTNISIEEFVRVLQMLLPGWVALPQSTDSLEWVNPKRQGLATYTPDLGYGVTIFLLDEAWTTTVQRCCAGLLPEERDLFLAVTGVEAEEP